MHRDKYPQLRECSTKGPSIAHFTNSPDNDFFLKKLLQDIRETLHVEVVQCFP
jgi:hypothetical protein